MKSEVLDLKGAEKALGITLIPNGKGSQALFDTVIGLQANRRAGTHSTKTKATVNASGKKPWRQKGTGNARAGYRSSPVWTGGGAAHGPKPRDYSMTLPKKVKKLALKKAISELAKGGRLSTFPSIELKAPKTKAFAAWLAGIGVTPSDTALVVLKDRDENVLRASRNLPNVIVRQAADVNAEELVLTRSVAIATDALSVLSQRMQ